jgi:hypothetical protein
VIDHAEICRINADGTTTYYWDNIEEAAQKWQPGCDDLSVYLSKLLLPLRPSREWVGLTEEDKLSLAEASGQQAIAMRVPKAGDRVICIEDDSAGTVEFTSAAGGPHIKFDDGSYGLWSLRQFGELFCYATPPRSEWAGLTDVQQEIEAAAKREKNYLNGYCTGRTDLLAEQANQEPVAWMVYTLDGKSVCVTDNPQDFTEQHRALPLYTNPPRREWVELTDEEIAGEFYKFEAASAWYQFARAIEAKHKEKNT